MHWLDWLVVGVYLIWIVWDGLKRTEGGDKVEGYFLANRSLPWWAVGLSVMATQLSAITLVGTTGQGYRDGMKFVQFYFGLPIAMLILSVTVVPFFYRAGVYTAYQYLERRFDVKTRTLTSALFLLSRGLQCGVIIAAPAVILSIILGWNLTLTVLAIGLPTALYTVIGGVQAVTWTDVKQMAVIVVGVLAAVAMLIAGLPETVTVNQALTVAGATGRLTSLDFTFNLTDTYTFWSGMIGGTFLMLSYFGCDQSQVQRYLTAKSVDEGRQSLMMSAYVKIPLQALILMTGVLVFVYYLFVQPPMLFNPVHETAVKTGPHKEAYAALERRFDRAFADRREAATAYAATQRTGQFRDDRRDAAALSGLRRPASRDSHRGRGPGEAIVGRHGLQRRQLRVSDLCDHTDAAGLDRAHHRGDLRGGHVEHRRRTQFAVDGDAHRLLQAPFQARRHRSALHDGVVDLDGGVGRGGLRRRDLCDQPRVAHRSGEPIRVVFLRIAARCVRAGHRHQARHGYRRIHRPHLRHVRRRVCRLPLSGNLLPLAQRRRRGRRGGGWHDD